MTHTHTHVYNTKGGMGRAFLNVYNSSVKWQIVRLQQCAHGETASGARARLRQFVRGLSPRPAARQEMESKKTKEKRNSCKASLQVLSPHQEKTRTLMLGSVRNNSQTSSTRWRIIGSAMFETFLRCTSHHSTATPFERRNNSFILEKD